MQFTLIFRSNEGVVAARKVGGYNGLDKARTECGDPDLPASAVDDQDRLTLQEIVLYPTEELARTTQCFAKSNSYITYVKANALKPYTKKTGHWEPLVGEITRFWWELEVKEAQLWAAWKAGGEMEYWTLPTQGEEET